MSNNQEEYNFNGVPVLFPYKAYESQQTFIKKLIETLQKGTNALLESPTGTGKTLSLLCGVLSWRRRVCEYLKSQGSQNMKQMHVSVGKIADKIRSPPRIIYTSRTHSQLSQVVSELRKTGYSKEVLTTILASREHLCINPIAKRSSSRYIMDAVCYGLRRRRRCKYYELFETENLNKEKKMGKEKDKLHHRFEQGPVKIQEKENNTFYERILNNKKVMDIEDLLKYGIKNNVCPFYFSRRRQTDADLILSPFNYVTSKQIRKALQLDLSNSVLIFDESHNLDQIFCESSSLSLTHHHFKLCKNELKTCLKKLGLNDGNNNENHFDLDWKNKHTNDFSFNPFLNNRFSMSQSISNNSKSQNKNNRDENENGNGNDLNPNEVKGLLSNLKDLKKSIQNSYQGNFEITKTGDFLIKMLNKTIDLETISKQIELIEKIIRYISRDEINDQESNSLNSKKFEKYGRGLNKLSEFFTTFFNENNLNVKKEFNNSQLPIYKSDYRVHITWQKKFSNNTNFKGGWKGNNYNNQRNYNNRNNYNNRRNYQNNSRGYNNKNNYGNYNSNNRYSNFKGNSNSNSNSDLYDKKLFSLDFWCFNPSITMKNIRNEFPQSIILTSGTLQPMNMFELEFQMPFPIKLSNKHVVNVQEQVFFGIVKRGENQISLNSSFNNRTNQNYLSSMGESIFQICKILSNSVNNSNSNSNNINYLYGSRYGGGGVLCFFPSFNLMNTCIAFWNNSGHINKISQYKTPIIEPKSNSQLKEQLMKFEKLNKNKGAIFFAVSRGKVSEGVDFSDDNGRVVILTGIPFAAKNDPKIKSKKEYLNTKRITDQKSKSQFSNTPRLNGNQWYCQEALKACNQAIGRIIRHKNDFGAIILLDERFVKNTHNLSNWLKPSLKVYNSFDNFKRNLSHFFKNINLKSKPNDNKQMIIKKEPVIQPNNLTNISEIFNTNDNHPQFSQLIFRNHTKQQIISNNPNNQSNKKTNVQFKQPKLLNHLQSFIPDNNKKSLDDGVNNKTSNRSNVNPKIKYYQEKKARMLTNLAYTKNLKDRVFNPTTDENKTLQNKINVNSKLKPFKTSTMEDLSRKRKQKNVEIKKEVDGVKEKKTQNQQKRKKVSQQFIITAKKNLDKYIFNLFCKNLMEINKFQHQKNKKKVIEGWLKMKNFIKKYFFQMEKNRFLIKPFRHFVPPNFQYLFKDIDDW
ncbi:regulator of telomere elongation helicase [Anaeramoeba flamelloides]|uniref:Regulator of telomere elongation helicase n=1 Tax=Anaeramoeba flamelloides TaxID=1746091 RepID=A0AAV7YKN1_9EUKA|nr:regulator of telomere elongation helicase [Anaeramoeba flamelloides]